MSALRRNQPSHDEVTLAWVNAGPTRAGSIFCQRCLAGATHRAEATGYRLESHWIGETRSRRAALDDIMFHRGIHDVIVAPLHEPTTIGLDWERLNAVAIGYSLRGPTLHRVAVDYCGSAQMCVQKLLAGSRRRVGLALSHSLDRDAHGLVTAGYAEAMIAAGLFRPELIHVRQKLRRDELLEWVRCTEVDAIIGFETTVPDWLRAAGHQVPATIAYASLDVPKCDGSCAGAYQDAEGVGASAVDLLSQLRHAHVRGCPPAPRVLVANSRWVDGITVAASLAGAAADGGGAR